jgi:glycosyltransferase involved in cell wall biosynthesis/spore maturation protein CgeB/SAM-dependent methyltransferase
MSAMLTMQQRGWEAYAGQLGVDLMQKTQKCLDWVSSKIEGEQVLDVDCGQGAILILLARAGKTVIGLTSDSVTIGQARSFISQEPAQVQRAITLKEGTLLDIASLVDRSFDTILLPQSVALSERPEDFIEVVYRKLKAGGRLISLWPFGLQTNTDPSYFLREPARIQACHFETEEMRLFGETLALVGKARPKVLERPPAANPWPDALVKEAEIALKQMERSVKGELRAAHNQLQALRKELDTASEQLAGLGVLRAEHESHAATLKAQLEAVQGAERDAISAAQSEASRLAEALKASQTAEANAAQTVAHVQAQSRILELEQAQQIAVLRHEKLQRDIAMQDLERSAADAQRDAELRVAQARADVLAIEKSLEVMQAARDAAVQQLQADGAAAQAHRDLLDQRLEETQAALHEKQAEVIAAKQKLEQIEVEAAGKIQQLQQAQQQTSMELESTRAQLEQARRDAAQELESLRRQEAQTEQLIAGREEHVLALQAQIAENLAVQETLRNAASAQGGQLKALRAEIAQHETRVRQLSGAQSIAVMQARESQARLSKMETELASTTAELKEARMKGREFLAQFRGSQAQEKEAIEKIRHLERRIRNLEQAKTQALLQVEQTRKTLSFQLGYALLHAFKSWSSFIGLPGELIRIHRDGKERRKRKLMKQQSTSRTSTTANFRTREEPNVAPRVSFVPSTSAIHSQNPQQKLKIAGIMDEFTFHSYAPECEMLQLRPEDWRTQVDEFQPDLIFVESAWKGVDDKWKGIISNCADEITALLAHCRAKGIPSIFWNKEDPVHFSTFIAVAALVDHVFTTDVDCLPKYKAALGHDRVALLPFAAQPKTHNPIEKFDRKDAFNFAGSYYLRYPERQRDFAALIDTVSSLKPVEIYDRNHEKPHPHYEFPEKYSSMILGSLPFSEIDRAYKGYRYGVNMNTIKQSQTMYARRVFELLASNTVVVSNFSRGVRVMFGDLVVCSDDASQIKKKLEPICSNELAYRKFRLQGLRKVMSQHTYRQRLQYIRAKLANEPVREQLRSVLVVAHAKDDQQRARTVESFFRQAHAAKTLYLVVPSNTAADLAQTGVRVFRSMDEMIAAVEMTKTSFDLIGGMTSQAYYGAHYLTDLALAYEYSDAMAYTKMAYYSLESSGALLLNDDGKQYKVSTGAAIGRSLFKTADLDSTQLASICDLGSPPLPVEALAIDEFNYCDMQLHTVLPADAQQQCSDSVIQDSGASFHADLIPIAEKIKKTLSADRPTADTLPKLSGKELHAVLPAPASKQIQIGLKDNKLTIRSTMPPDKFAYIYATKIFSREELNLVLNSHFEVMASNPQEIKSVFEFQDESGKKIAHQMNPIGGGHTLAIPTNCAKIRFGLRIQGSGSATIEAIVFGSHGEPPATLVSRSPYLVLTKQYPAYDDLYRYGFLHSRVRSYRDAGLDVDVFRLTNVQETPYREFEGIDVASGDLQLLDQTLASGQYKKVLVHLLDEKMWSVLEKHLDKVKVDIWIHGAEIQVWQRREFEFERMSKEEIVRQKRLSDKRVKFWKKVLQPRPHPNVHLVFVSKYFADEVVHDLGATLHTGTYSIVHNYIDSNIFQYEEKDNNQRLKLLSIRPYASRKYANDLTIGCILKLSNRPFFKDLEFNLYGDGDLFDSTTAPVREFSNVSCHKRFLSQHEIAAIHRDHGIFLTPTRMDAQGVSRDEAMSSGLVPITNAVAAIPEFVDDDCGYAVPAEDIDAMAAAVEAMYMNPSEFQRKSRNAASRVRGQCGFNETIEKELVRIKEIN